MELALLPLAPAQSRQAPAKHIQQVLHFGLGGRPGGGSRPTWVLQPPPRLEPPAQLGGHLPGAYRAPQALSRAAQESPCRPPPGHGRLAAPFLQPVLGNPTPQRPHAVDVALSLQPCPARKVPFRSPAPRGPRPHRIGPRKAAGQSSIGTKAGSPPAVTHSRAGLWGWSGVSTRI